MWNVGLLHVYFLKIKTRIKTNYNNIDCDSVLPKFFSLNFILILLAVNSSEGPSLILLHDNILDGLVLMNWLKCQKLVLTRLSKVFSSHHNMLQRAWSSHFHLKDAYIRWLLLRFTTMFIIQITMFVMSVSFVNTGIGIGHCNENLWASNLVWDSCVMEFELIFVTARFY